MTVNSNLILVIVLLCGGYLHVASSHLVIKKVADGKESDVVTQYNTEAGVETLLSIRKEFYISDYDDDNFVTVENCLRWILMDDLNNDGVVTFEEAKANPDTPRFPYNIFKAWDKNHDDVIDIKDANFITKLLPGTGNKVGLEDALTIDSTRLNETFGPVMKIKAFVQAERDYLIIDEDDDNIVNGKEWKLQFRIADKNKNGKLENSEVRDMFPMRSTPPEIICPNMAVSCSVDDVMPLFNAADKNKDSKLSIEEYIKYFGHLIEIPKYI